ncbi:MAG TPA: HAMP domain-containing sensor histidine kinase [Blastocatellia bacterium]|nr:HAMP domain-containing sensor histidine kinase [Blastocatellia bacterium]
MMGKTTHRQLWMLSLALGLLVLLPLLAVFQYHWLGQVSEGERERKKSVLTTMAKQFCNDFDDGLTEIYLRFKPPQFPPIQLDGQLDQFQGPEAEDDFAAKYRSWRETAARPKLIKDVYRTQAGEGGEILSRYNVETGDFERCEWPDGMSNLRKKLKERRARDESLLAQVRETARLRINIHEEGGVKKIVSTLKLNLVDADLPALVIPESNRPEERVMPLLGARSYRIIAFDADYIIRELIPELAERHFADSAGEYTIAVTKREQTDQVLYRSDAGVPETDLDNGDVTTGFFKIVSDENNRLFLTRIHRSEMKASDQPKLPSNRQQILIMDAGENKSGKGESGAAPQRRLIGTITDGITPQTLDRDGVWRLVAKHRAGSLEAAVANARRRNLAISFGILSLLGVSVGFIMLSSRRAHRLATQQMEFVAGVSHELRTPLTVICSAAENLADGVTRDRDQIKRYGELIRDEGRRLTGMVEQVLEFAGAQSGRKSYELRPTDLNQVIEDAITACHMRLAESDFEIEKKIAPYLPSVKADAGALGRAIQNLLSNATKYSGDSRWIGLSAEPVKTADGEEVQIKISDRGLGVPPFEQERIFEPFYRGKEAQSAQIHGNGLGLSLVKHIAAAHGGRVSVESNIGQGSVFILHLPV